MVKSVSMAMSNKIIPRGTQLAKTSGIKKEQKIESQITTLLSLDSNPQPLSS